jgi:hypothetical protein
MDMPVILATRPQRSARSEPSDTASAASGAIKHGSRAAVLRRSEATRFSSTSDDKVGGFPARSARSERSEWSNQTRIARRRAAEE